MKKMANATPELRINTVLTLEEREELDFAKNSIESIVQLIHLAADDPNDALVATIRGGCEIIDTQFDRIDAVLKAADRRREKGGE